MDSTITIINNFDVPQDGEAAFESHLAKTKEVMASQPGLVSAELHRAKSAARFRYVIVSRWASLDAYRRALTSTQVNTLKREGAWMPPGVVLERGAYESESLTQEQKS